LSDILNKAAVFLQDNCLEYGNINFEQEIDRFIGQMEKGLISDTGLPMVPTYIEGNLRPVQGRKAIAVDVGGTNLRVALLELKGLRTEIIKITKAPVLGKDKPVSFSMFMNNLVDHIEHYLEYSRIVCFSFSHRIQHDHADGFVSELSKEITITGISGKPLASSLREAIRKRTGLDTKVILMNDTVGVAGSLLQLGEAYQNYFGVVMGTGFNACYIEQAQNIKKIDDAVTDTMFINVESGSYVPSRVSRIDQEFDATTVMPDTAALEKMVSGEYLGKLFFYLVRKACRNGLFTNVFVERFNQYNDLGTKDLSALYEDSGTGIYRSLCSNDDDRELLGFFAKCVIERAAALVSIKILAISKKIYRPVSSPIGVIVEGATFYGLKGFREKVLDNITEYAGGMKIELFNVQDAALVGIGNIGLAFA
jgi:hexokinase